MTDPSGTSAHRPTVDTPGPGPQVPSEHRGTRIPASGAGVDSPWTSTSLDRTHVGVGGRWSGGPLHGMNGKVWTVYPET